MTTAYTSLLGLALPVTGELQGTWGDTVNNYITSYLDAAVAGTQTLSTDADVTLTKTTNASLSSTSSQYSILLFSGARTAQRTVTVPAASKIYTVINKTTGGYAVKVVGSGPTTGITIANGESAVIAWNGSDFIKISNTAGGGSFTDLTATGTITFNTTTNSQSYTTTGAGTITISSGTAGSINNMNIGATTAGTGKFTALTNTALTSGRVVYSTTGGLETDSANLTFDGTSLTLGGNPTLSAGTANGVLYLNGSKVATSGSALTFDGSNFKLTGSDNNNLVYSANSNGTASIRMQSNAAGNYLVGAGPDPLYFQNGSATGYLVFAPASSTEGMRLTSTGLGVGTSSPAVKLDVNGSVNISSGQNLTWGGAYAANIPTMYAVSGANGYFYWSPRGNTGSYMTLDANSNLGLGVTPSAWASGAKALQIKSYGALYESVAGKTTLTFNSYESATNTYKYLQTEAASMYQQVSGGHYWFTAPSGTAGNAISFTQAMTLDASGRLGIGETSPSYSIDVKAPSSGDTTIRLTKSGSINTTINAVSGAMTFGVDASGGTTERARITSGGDLLVGTTTANSQTGITLRADGVIVAKGVYNTLVSSNTRDIYMDDSGFFGYISSTRASKTNIADITDVSWLLALKPVSFNYKKFDRETNAHTDEPVDEIQYGLIAEDVEAVKSELCFYDKVDGKQVLRGVSYSKLITPMLKIIQEQQAIITDLRARVAQLEAK